jgi:AcrR family transcriptional regulator
MIESVARRGYHATTVADVITLAGVSRRAFYEHFGDKEGCLTTTHHSIVGRARGLTIEAWDSQHGWTNRLHASCRSLFDDVLKHPGGARLVLVDSVAIYPRARERMTFASLVFERLLRNVMQAHTRGPDLPLLPPSAIVGGVRQAVFARIREHRETELSTLADEVLDWIESYRPPREARLAPPANVVLDVPQTPALFQSHSDPRARILAATVRLILESGYINLTDSQLAKAARLSTQALHQEFPSKEACLLAALDSFICETLELVRAELRHDISWPTEIHHAMNTYVAYLASHRALVRLAFIDLFDVGPAVVGQMTRSAEELTKLLTDNCPAPRRGPLVAREAITGAIWAIIFGHAADDRAWRPSALADQLTFVMLAPYVGAKAAIEEAFLRT